METQFNSMRPKTMTTKITFKALMVVPVLASTNAASQEINVFQQIIGGGISMIAIAALSILALSVTIERLRCFKVNAIAPEGLIEKVAPLWKAGEWNKLKTILSAENSTLARLISYMVSHRALGPTIISARCGEIASMELRQHQQRAYPLAVVATVAPIVGLLGTVIGMIEAFHVISHSGGLSDPALLAAGISKALVNTAAGLSVALPSLAMHHFFKNRLVLLGLALEKDVNLLINEWSLQGGGGMDASLPADVAAAGVSNAY
jgi:biopolymer transport protein ExbB